MPAAVSRSFARSLVDPSHTPPRLGFGADLGNGMGRTLMKGERNSAIYPPLAAAVNSLDRHLPKNRMSGLWNEETPLRRYLKQSKHKTLLFSGVNTDQCVLGTLADAYNAGWDCVLVEDCCATTTGAAQNVSVANVAVSFCGLLCWGFSPFQYSQRQYTDSTRRGHTGSSRIAGLSRRASWRRTRQTSLGPVFQLARDTGDHWRVVLLRRIWRGGTHTYFSHRIS